MLGLNVHRGPPRQYFLFQFLLPTTEKPDQFPKRIYVFFARGIAKKTLTVRTRKNRIQQNSIT